MGILLDTHVFIWAAGKSGRLTSAVRSILERPDERIFFSSISAAEIAIKWSKGRLRLPKRPLDFINEVIAEAGYSPLTVTIRDACAVGDLPYHHKDPFDRILIAQAKTNGLRLMTADPVLEKYDVDVIALWLDEDDE